MSRTRSDADVFVAVADATRRRMLERLAAGEAAAMELARLFASRQPTISKHLAVLRRSGLVRVRRAGRNQLYRLAPEGLRPLHDWAGQFERFWAEKLAKLGEYLDNRNASAPAASPSHVDELPVEAASTIRHSEALKPPGTSRQNQRRKST